MNISSEENSHKAVFRMQDKPSTKHSGDPFNSDFQCNHINVPEICQIFYKRAILETFHL